MKEYIIPYAAHGVSKNNHHNTQKFILGALGAFVLITVAFHGSTLLSTQPDYHLRSFDEKAYNEGMGMCRDFNVKADQTINVARTNPRFVPGTKSTLILNATLIDGDGSVHTGRDILLRDGVVVSTDYLSASPDLDENMVIWPAGGHFVSPGLIDMHSHAGVNSLPNFWGDYDTNEVSDPITSQVRTIDAINPSDEMFRRILSGGVTSSLILPGSANLMGGEAFVLKHRPVKSLKVEDMLVQAGVTTKRQRWIKMACGENPKAVYSKKTHSRLGVAWGFRHRFDEAKQLMVKQDHWCAKAIAGAQFVAGEHFPSDLELESVVGVLRGDVSIHNHCYETMDLEMQIRNSKEFNFTIAAFHHALDAYLVPDMMRENNITVATFANLWGYKKEAFQGSVHAGKILTDSGVALAYKSDHPVTNSQNLIYQAQIGYHFGVPEDLAFASVASVPAKAVKLANRIGYLRQGYDADVLLWSDHPLNIGAYPLQVWIDGAPQIEMVPEELEIKPNAALKPLQTLRPATPKAQECIEGARSLVLKGVKQSFLHDTTEALGDSSLTVVVQDGRIICHGTEAQCSEVSASSIAAGANVMDLVDAYVVHGITTTAPLLGLGEIKAEQSTLDGKVDNSKVGDPESIISAFDGLVFGGPHMARAHARGVLDVITAPSGQFLQGLSVAFKTFGSSILEEDAVVKEAAALHFTIGHEAKIDEARSVSSQISSLRKILEDNKPKNNTYGAAANGTLPLVIDANNADEIGHLILLKREFPEVHLVIKGGVEAYMIADDLAKADISVLLDHHRCMPETYRTRHCLPGPPLTASTNLRVLHEAGVKVALVGNDDGNLGEQYWEAAWATKLAGNFTDKEALALVSTDVREILRLPKMEDSFVVFQGHPFEWRSEIALTFDRGRVATCFPVLP